jgi:hypothetical protein
LIDIEAVARSLVKIVDWCLNLEILTVTKSSTAEEFRYDWHCHVLDNHLFLDIP